VYVRPKLEYNTVVWSPSALGDIKLIERVLRVFTKRILPYDQYNGNYAGRLAVLNIPPLEMRRWCFDLIIVYKIVNKRIDLKFEDFFQFAPNQLRSRGSHCLKLLHRSDSGNLYRNYRRNFFSNRIPPVWNALPEQVVTAPLEKVFKKRLVEFQGTPEGQALFKGLVKSVQFLSNGREYNLIPFSTALL
jgi:hypothetical protein